MPFVGPTCNQESERDKVTIIPGNLNSGLEGERGIFHRNMILS